MAAIIGDGSMQYSVQGLWTAAQHQLPILFVIPENRQYGILKSFAVLEDTPGVRSGYSGLDIAALATGYGCTAVRAETEAEVIAACKAALQRKGPTVLVVPIRPSVPPLM